MSTVQGNILIPISIPKTKAIYVIHTSDEIDVLLRYNRYIAKAEGGKKRTIWDQHELTKVIHAVSLFLKKKHFHYSLKKTHN